MLKRRKWGHGPYGARYPKSLGFVEASLVSQPYPLRLGQRSRCWGVVGLPHWNHGPWIHDSHILVSNCNRQSKNGRLIVELFVLSWSCKESGTSFEPGRGTVSSGLSQLSMCHARATFGHYSFSAPVLMRSFTHYRPAFAKPLKRLVPFFLLSIKEVSRGKESVCCLVFRL